MTGEEALKTIKRVRKLFRDLHQDRVRPVAQVETHDGGVRISVKRILVRCTPEDDR